MPDFTVSADIDAFLVAANDAAARGELALTSIALVTPGTGVNTALAINVGSAGAFLTFNGAGGTPSSMVGTNITGTAAGLTAGAASAVAVGGITGLGAGVGTFLATPSGANLATALTTALPATKGGTGLTALGTGIATALGVNANSGGGLIVLADPGADRIPFWDDSAGVFTFLTVGTGLDITNTTLTATGAGATAVTAASVAAGAGLFWVSGGADRSASATDTVATINATNANATTLVLGGVTITATGTELNFTDGVTSAIQTQLDARQPLDSDLTTIAGLTATTDNFIQSKSSAWASRTVAQVSVDLQGTGLITDAVGFRTVPQNSQSTAYTAVAADSGKHILHPTADNNARTFTIPANASVAFPVGTCITFINQINTVTIAINSDTLVLAGAGTTGSRTLAANGMATATKVASTVWFINGTGLT
jgi:hypothetical protein